MKHMSRQMAAFPAGAVTIVGLGLGGAALASNQQDKAADDTHEPTVSMIECIEGNTVVKPTEFTLACGDGNERLTKLDWSNWDKKEATATGIDEITLDGKTETYPVKVVASDLVLGEAVGAYTKLTVEFTDEVPEGAQKVETFKLIGVDPYSDDTDATN